MATAKKVGVLVKEARTAAGLTQEKLAKAAGENLTAADISKCEQMKEDLTVSQLKAIAKACGVTQTSLVNAPKNVSASAAKKTTAAGKTSAAAAKKTTASSSKKTSATTTAKKTATTKKTTVPASANISMKVTSAEQKLIEAYRSATSDNKKLALKLLKGEINENVTGLLGTVTGTSTSGADGLADMLTNALTGFLGGK